MYTPGWEFQVETKFSNFPPTFMVVWKVEIEAKSSTTLSFLESTFLKQKAIFWDVAVETHLWQFLDTLKIDTENYR